jgi:WD40 repeat protein
VRLWDAATGAKLRVFSGHAAPVWSVAFAPDGQTFLSGGADGTARLWDVTTGEALRIFGDHASAVRSVAFAPDGLTALSGGGDGARLWDLRTGDTLRVFAEGATYGVLRAVFAPNGAWVATASFEYGVRLWGLPDR